MSKAQTATVDDGPAALERFRQALKRILSVPKSRVIEQEKALHKTRKPASPKG